MDTTIQPTPANTVPSKSHVQVALILSIAFVIIIGVLVGVLFKKNNNIPYPQAEIHLRDSIIAADKAKIDLLQQQRDKIADANAELIKSNIALQVSIDRRTTKYQQDETQRKHIADHINSSGFNADSIIKGFQNYSTSN